MSLLVCSIGHAQEIKDSVKIHFRQGYSVLDLSLRDNRASLERIADSLRMGQTDSVYRLRKILVVGGASPEGSIPLNRRLSERRANVLFDYLSRYGDLPDSLTVFTYLGRDWRGLLRLAEQDTLLPYRKETLEFLHDIISRLEKGENVADNNVGRLASLKNGEPYRYMYRKLFPELRASRLYLWYRKVWNPLRLPEAADIPVPRESVKPFQEELPPMYLAVASSPKPFYMGIKTNMLYDLLLLPNIGVEFYLGKNWSLAGDWMYGWWKKDRIHWYWRAYGGGFTLRKWLGRRAAEKPLTGHHIGLYGRALTYDFEIGGRGYMGGEPGGTLFDRANFGVGVEYGYSWPVARRLNVDFTLGIGYLGGKYYEYLPVDDCYVWQATKNRRYFGPTRLEVSLVWLVGRGNVNNGKGGAR